MKKWTKICLLFVGVITVVALSVYAALPNWLGTDAEPSDQAAATGTVVTYIYNERATDAGQIDSIEVFVADTGATALIQFAVMDSLTGTSFRDTSVTIDFDVSDNGLNVFTIDPPMPIAVGQYIAFTFSADGNGTLDKATSGGGGYYWVANDVLDSTVSTVEYALSGNTEHDMQIRAYVTAVGGGDEPTTQTYITGPDGMGALHGAKKRVIKK